MPRELKKRGRREEKKRKAIEEPSTPPKRQRTYDEEPNPEPELEVCGDAGDDFIQFGEQSLHNEQIPSENQFYGLLDEDEQSYYTNVNSKLTANDFESDEDRILFVQAVHRETQGKELKVASSQSCSRYLERIIMLSDAGQLRALFTAFLENITYLVQHRFGSHCCEALFKQSSKFLKSERNSNDSDANLEDLLLQSVEHLSPNLGFLVTDRFASHCVRVLLLILSGEQVNESSQKVLASRRKEKIELPESWERHNTDAVQIPKSFNKAREDLITAAFAGLDTTYVRALATHPIGNPFLQLVVKTELTLHGKSQDRARQLLFPNLFPDQEFEPESDTGKFTQGLLYDPAGSHLIETLVLYLPGKLFKKLYGNILKERMQNLAKNDIASYVAIRVIERLSKDDLLQVYNVLQPEIPTLIDRSRLGLIKVLFERFIIRKIDSEPLVTQIVNFYGNKPIMLLPELLKFQSGTVTQEAQTDTDVVDQVKADLHGSLLVQAMAQDLKGALALQASFLVQPMSTLLLMAKNNIASRALQAILRSDQASPKFLKQAIPKFLGTIADLAKTAAGSHVVDALWNATNGMHFLKESIARELAQEEGPLRESIYGRTVWHNWSMDMYRRRPGEWHALAKGRSSLPDTPAENTKQVDNLNGKSAIQLARERFAKSKGRKLEDSGSRSIPIATRN